MKQHFATMKLGEERATPCRCDCCREHPGQQRSNIWQFRCSLPRLTPKWMLSIVSLHTYRSIHVDEMSCVLNHFLALFHCQVLAHSPGGACPFALRDLLESLAPLAPDGTDVGYQAPVLACPFPTKSPTRKTEEL